MMRMKIRDYMNDIPKRKLIAGIIAFSGVILIGLCAHPASSIEDMGIIIGIVLLAFGGILKGSVQE
jgi:hypothetical protein